MWNARSVFLILSAAIFAVKVVANPEVLIARQGSVHHLNVVLMLTKF